MVPKEFLLIAADADNDRFGAALVTALRNKLTSAEAGYEEGLQPLHASLEPRFYGAGGPAMAAAGVGIVSEAEALRAARTSAWRRLLAFRRAFGKLYRLALDREPQVILGLGFFGFNLRFARSIRRYIHRRAGTFYNWDPLIVQYGAPAVWPRRTSRVEQLAAVLDLLLLAEPLAKARYAPYAPNVRLELLDDSSDPAHVPEIARQAAGSIVQLMRDSEERFPLRAYLSESMGRAA